MTDPRNELCFTWQDRKYCLVTLDGRFLIVMNRDVQSLDEMRLIQLALLSAAGIAGWDVHVKGDEGL